MTLAALLAASTATGAWAQATADDDGGDGEAQTDQPQADPAQADEGQADEAQAEDGTEVQAEEASEEPAAGEADVTIIQEEAPAEEEEAEIVVEEEPAEPTIITTDPAAEEGDATVVEEEAVIVEEAPAEDEAVVVEEAEAEEAEVEVETPVEGQIFEQSADQLLGSTLLDTSVASPDGETIGDVQDMVISSDGQITGVVIGVGGFLGIGEKRVAMEFDRIQVQPQEGGDLLFVLDATREQLEAAPEFKRRPTWRPGSPPTDAGRGRAPRSARPRAS